MAPPVILLTGSGVSSDVNPLVSVPLGELSVIETIKEFVGIRNNVDALFAIDVVGKRDDRNRQDILVRIDVATETVMLMSGGKTRGVGLTYAGNQRVCPSEYSS